MGTGIFIAILLSAPAQADAAAAETPLTTNYHFEELKQKADGTLSDRGRWLIRSTDWLTVADLPPSVRNKPGKGRTVVRTEVRIDGLAAGCVPVEGPADAAAAICRALEGQKKLPTTYAAPGKPMTKFWHLSMAWETLTQEQVDERKAAAQRRGPPPAPPAPPPGYATQWPPRWAPDRLQITTLPDIEAFVPASETRGKGTIGLFAMTDKEREEPECMLKVSSGNAALDAAACRFVESVRLRYTEPCDDCWGGRGYPFIIVFDGRRSHVRLPRAGYGFAQGMPKLSGHVAIPAEAAALKAAPRTNSHVSARVAVDAAGRVTSCRMGVSAGSPQADEIICAILRKQNFTPAVDVFGDPMAGEAFVPINLANM